MIAAAFTAGGILLLSWWIFKPDWRVLYGGLDNDDARQMAQTLSQAQIPFEVTPDGSGLRVPAAQLDKARLATAAKGGVKSGRMGFELFDRPNWVGSEFDEQVNYQRALEGELEHTVASLSDVASARVHLVLPHDSMFREQERPAKASVLLKLRHRSLAEGEPEAIRNLVASAVDGLAPERVVLMDAAGHVPMGPRTADALRLNAEKSLEEKLIATLEPVTGAGNVRASVTLDYDDSAQEQTRETYDPASTVTLSMQRTEQNSGGQPVAAGIPGTASNAPNAQTLPVYPRENVPPQSAKSESSTYGASKTVIRTSENPGRLRRLTAAIVVNDRMVQAAAGSKPAQWQARSTDELRNLTVLAQAAVGFSGQRGDFLTVEDLAFDDNRPQPRPALLDRAFSSMHSAPEILRYGSMLLGLVVLTAFGIRPALRKMIVPQPQMAKPGALPEVQAAVPLEPPHAPDRTRAQEILEQVEGHVKREPQQTSRLLQSWIHSE
jgi:flagellar M-ring protein FliF